MKITKKIFELIIVILKFIRKTKNNQGIFEDQEKDLQIIKIVFCQQTEKQVNVTKQSPQQTQMDTYNYVLYAR